MIKITFSWYKTFHKQNQFTHPRMYSIHITVSRYIWCTSPISIHSGGPSSGGPTIWFTLSSLSPLECTRSRRRWHPHLNCFQDFFQSFIPRVFILKNLGHIGCSADLIYFRAKLGQNWLIGAKIMFNRRLTYPFFHHFIQRFIPRLIILKTLVIYFVVPTGFNFWENLTKIGPSGPPNTKRHFPKYGKWLPYLLYYCP